MATRRLEVQILGDPASAQRAFRSVGTQASLLEQRFGRIGRTANTALGAAGRRVSALGAAARSATPYVAAGLAVGIGKAVAEAREANKTMAQTEAVIKSTGGAANVTAEDVERLSAALSVQAGVDDELIGRGANLLLTFKNIRNEVGAGNDIFNQATAVALDMSAALGQDMKASAIQLGKALNDPTVGLTALRRVGVSFTEQQSEQILAMHESGDSLGAQKLILRELTSEFEGSAEAQADSFDKLKVVFDNLAEDVGMKITPVLADLGDKVADIVTDKKLSDMEKFERISDLFEEIGIKAIKALEAIAPQVAEVGAKMSGRFALAFGRAFLEADILGKLFLGGLFIRAIGGPGAFRAVGVLIGKHLGRGIAIGMVIALPFLIKEVHDWVSDRRFQIRQIGADIGEWIINGLIDVVNFGIEKINEILPGQIKVLGKEIFPGIPDIPSIPKIDIKGPKESLRELQETAESRMENLRSIAEKGIHRTGDELDRGGKRARGELFPHWRGMLKDADHNLGDIEQVAERRGENVRDKLDRRTDQMAGRVGRNVARMVNKVGEGLKVLGENTNEALNAFGVAAAKKVSISVTKVGESISSFGRQRGGSIPGFQSGDIVPAMLEPGEFVVNRNAVATFGPLIEAMNAAAPRFQGGGAVAGLQSGIANLATTIARRFGLSITSGLRPGDPGFHGRGLAADVSGAVPNMNRASAYISGSGIWRRLLEGIYSGSPPLSVDTGQRVSPSFWGAGTWAAHADHLHLALSGALGAAAARVARVILKGPAGPLRDMGQASLDRTHRAANAFLRRKTRFAVGPETGAGGLSKGALTRLWTNANRGFGNANLMAAIALAESGGVPSAHGPPDGRGLWQIEWPIWSRTLSRFGNPYNPLSNARMAGEVLRRQGLGAWVVYNTGAHRQFLQGGGRVGPRSGPLAGPLRRAIGERRDIGEILRGLERRERRLERRRDEAETKKERRELRDRLHETRRRQRERERDLEATQELISSLRELRLELKEQRSRAQAERLVSRQEIRRALTDEFGYLLGAAANPTLRTAGAGSVTRS